MSSNLFPEPDSDQDQAPTAKPALKPVADARQRHLEILTLTLGLEDAGLTVRTLEQDGRNPEDSILTIELDNNTRIELGPIATVMSRPKVHNIMVIRLGVSPAAMKAAEWQDTIATVIRNAATIVQTSQSLASRAQDWATQYLSYAPTSPDLDTASINREPFRAPDGRAHLVLAPLATWVAKNTTEKLTERQLAAALRDAGWEQQTLMYYTEGRDPSGKGRGKRTSASYWREPAPEPETDE